MNNVFYFGYTAVVFIIIVAIILKILIKKFNPEKSKIKLYGLLKGMSNSEIISLSCLIIVYLFLIYLMFSFVDLDIVIVIISLLLTLISGLLIKNKFVIIDIILNCISLGGIKIVYLIHDYIINEYMDIWMLLLLVFVMIFLFLYLTYNLFKNLNNVITSNKYIRRSDKNEN